MHNARVALCIRRDSPYNRMTQSFNVFNAVVQFITFSAFPLVAFEFFMVLFKLCFSRVSCDTAAAAVGAVVSRRAREFDSQG